jgi:hypothetical protein
VPAAWAELRVKVIEGNRYLVGGHLLDGPGSFLAVGPIGSGVTIIGCGTKVRTHDEVVRCDEETPAVGGRRYSPRPVR